jgi:hypothetical protein
LVWLVRTGDSCSSSISSRSFPKNSISSNAETRNAEDVGRDRALGGCFDLVAILRRHRGLLRVLAAEPDTFGDTPITRRSEMSRLSDQYARMTAVAKAAPRPFSIA